MIASCRAPLYVPASRPELFQKAARSGADALVLDLEDAVAVADKEMARHALEGMPRDIPVIVRTNGLHTPWHDDDLEAVAMLRPAAVMMPKVERAEHMHDVAERLGPDIGIIAIVETALGMAGARMVAASGPVVRVAFGSVDYCADLGMAHLREILMPARLELVLASRLAGIAPPLDGVTVQVDAPELAGEDARHARSLGMTGKLCIHPGQVSAVRAAFIPSHAEIAWARKVLASGDGAVAVDGAMVDEPVRIRARAILAETAGD